MKIYKYLIIGIVIFLLPGMLISSGVPPSRQLYYKLDSTGFTFYPHTFLLDSLKLPARYRELEFNTIVSGYKKTIYRNLNRFPKPAHLIPDKVVLSKCDPLKTFSAEVHPALLRWYISAYDSKKQVITINDTSLMKSFLHSLKNKFNAYLWFQVKIGFSEIPVRTSHTFSYKRITDGYLIRYRGLLKTAPTSTAELTYFVGDDFSVRLVEKSKFIIHKCGFK